MGLTPFNEGFRSRHVEPALGETGAIKGTRLFNLRTERCERGEL